MCCLCVTPETLLASMQGLRDGEQNQIKMVGNRPFWILYLKNTILCCACATPDILFNITSYLNITKLLKLFAPKR